MNTPIYLDIHTHSADTLSETKAIRCLMTHESIAPNQIPNSFCSVGIHPWFISEDNYESLIEISELWSAADNVVAIGESGLDKKRGADMTIQKNVFIHQIALSEKLRKPLIVHCVKAWDELFAIHTQYKPTMRWIIHGFMGSVELARQLLNRGFGISLWYSFALSKRSIDVIKIIPKGSLYLETDSSNADIRTIYSEVARNLSIDIDTMSSRIGTI